MVEAIFSFVAWVALGLGPERFSMQRLVTFTCSRSKPLGVSEKKNRATFFSCQASNLLSVVGPKNAQNGGANFFFLGGLAILNVNPDNYPLII